MDARKFRSEISKMKSTLTDKDLFTSQGFKQIVENIVKGITRAWKVNLNVMVDWGHKNGPIAFASEDNDVYLNVNNAMFDNMDTGKKYRLFLGLILHECGHRLYTDFRIKRKYCESIINNMYLSDLTPCVNSYLKKNPSSAPLVARLYMDFENRIEDGFIELILLNQFHGYGKYLQELRNYQLKGALSLEEMILEDYPDQHIFWNLLLIYAKYHIIIAEDDIYHPALEKLIMCKSQIDMARTEKNASYRMQHILTAFDKCFCLLIPPKKQPEQREKQDDKYNGDSNSYSTAASDNNSLEDSQNGKNEKNDSNNDNQEGQPDASKDSSSQPNDNSENSDNNLHQDSSEEEKNQSTQYDSDDTRESSSPTEELNDENENSSSDDNESENSSDQCNDTDECDQDISNDGESSMSSSDSNDEEDESMEYQDEQLSSSDNSKEANSQTDGLNDENENSSSVDNDNENSSDQCNDTDECDQDISNDGESSMSSSDSNDEEDESMEYQDEQLSSSDNSKEANSQTDRLNDENENSSSVDNDSENSSDQSNGVDESNQDISNFGESQMDGTDSANEVNSSIKNSTGSTSPEEDNQNNGEITSENTNMASENELTSNSSENEQLLNPKVKPAEVSEYDDAPDYDENLSYDDISELIENILNQFPDNQLEEPDHDYDSLVYMDTSSLPENNFEDNPQNKSDSADGTINDISDLMDACATEKVIDQEEERINDLLITLKDEMTFGKYHIYKHRGQWKEIQGQINRINEFYDDAELSIEVNKVLRRLLQEFLRHIKDLQLGDTLKGLYSGKRVSQAYRHDLKRFSNTKAPEDIPDMALILLVDESGSMSGKRILHARTTALLIYRFCRKLGIKVSIIGHGADMEGNVYLNVYAAFDSIDGKDDQRIQTMQAHDWCNRDGYALRYCSELLLTQNTEQKICMNISDGAPNDIMYGYSFIPKEERNSSFRLEDQGNAKLDIQECIRDYSRKGIDFITAGIGDDTIVIKDIYTDGLSAKSAPKFLDISNEAQMPKIFVEILKDKIMKKS